MPIQTGEDYINSLRNRNLQIYFMGEKISDPVEHPLIRPSINAMAETYNLANTEPKLASVFSPLIGKDVNRFLHVAFSSDDVVMQNHMQRKLGQKTGTCFQRCVGMDAVNALYSVTFDCDQIYQTPYHDRFKKFLCTMQKENFVIGGAMTDPKGDRAKGPSEQSDPDLFLRITKRTNDGVFVSGAKMHQTGCINSHWLIAMPTMRLQEADKDYAIVAALPTNNEGLIYIYGRQSCDTRALEKNQFDCGNKKFSGQEAIIIFNNVFIPNEFIFMNGEYDFAATLVERFTSFHRRSYVCKAGVGDVLIGASASMADYNGASKASHIKDKLVEMNLLNETIFASGIAASYCSKKTQAGNFQADPMLANVCKQHVTRVPFELAKMAQDIAGGLVGTLPSHADFESEITGPWLKKFLQTTKDCTVENRRSMLRLIENMTMGRNAVGYLTESIHGAGSPQAQRIQINRLANMEEKKSLAKNLAQTKI